MERLQLVLDGELAAGTLEMDPHLSACASCSRRFALARMMMNALAPRHESPVPQHLTHSILTAVSEARTATIRRKSFIVSGVVVTALAASVLLLLWINRSSPQPVVPLDGKPQPDLVQLPPAAPEPRPMRIGDEVLKVGVALRETAKPITQPVAGAP
jgi:hypothetical protein